MEISQIRLAEFDLAGARAAAARLATLAPDSVEAHRALAAVSLAEQDYAQAEFHYGNVLEMEPLDEEAHERFAMAKDGRRREQQRSQRHRRRRG
jgi:Flp pilus assembly protein TadD